MKRSSFAVVKTVLTMAGSDELPSGDISQSLQGQVVNDVLCSIPYFYKESSVFITGATGKYLYLPIFATGQKIRI